jgi:threonine/homoserine/homoserine lactone efflux protein
MPTSHVLFKMALYVSLVLITPGPTNTLLLSSGIKVGFRGSWHLVIAEALGYAVAISLWGFFLVSFAATRPWLYDAVKLASSIYIFHLALVLWKSPKLQNISTGPVSFRDLFVATMMNPKSLLFASAIFPAQAFMSFEYFVWTLAVFLVVLAPIGAGWTSLGGILTSQRSWAVHTSTLLRGASVVLLMFSGTLVFSVLNR